MHSPGQQANPVLSSCVIVCAGREAQQGRAARQVVVFQQNGVTGTRGPVGKTLPARYRFCVISSSVPGMLATALGLHDAWMQLLGGFECPRRYPGRQKRASVPMLSLLFGT